MRFSTPTYRAFLIGAPDVELHIDRRAAGDITLDPGQAPHVQGAVTFNPRSRAVLDALDPRVSARVRIECESVFPGGVSSRVFDLGLRRRAVSQKDAVAVTRLASDEALLDDYRPLADAGLFALQGSLRAIVNHVLAAAIPGATLAPGTIDPPVRALIDSQNLVRNPRAQLNLNDWSGSVALTRHAAGGPVWAPSYAILQSPGVGVLISYSEAGVPLQGGKRYRLSADIGAPVGQIIALDALVKDAAGTTILDVAESPVAKDGSAFQRLSVVFDAPATAAKAQLRAFTTGPVAAGQYFGVTGWRVSEVTIDPTDTGYYDGDTPDTAEYSYSWAAGGAFSTSNRVDILGRADDLLVWRAGVSALEFLMPIVQAFGLRLVCDEHRVWTLRDENYRAPGALSVRYGINMVDGDDTLDRDGGWFDAAVVRHRWRDQNNVEQERTEAFALHTPYTRCVLFERTTPYPGPGFAEYAVRRAQGRGRDVSVTRVPDWSEQPEQLATLILDGAPIQIGITQAVTFDLGNTLVTVTSRTTDTPPGAIDLLQGTIDSLVGTINDL